MPNRSVLMRSTAVLTAMACLALQSAFGGGTKPATGTKTTSTFGQKVLAEFDSNKNGRLESGERAAATRVLTSKEIRDTNRDSLRRAALTEYDADKSGSLDREEVQSVLQAATTAQKAAATAKASTTTLSANSSTVKTASTTSSGTSRQQPFQMQIGQQSLAAQSFLKKFDVNGDGTLDQTELAAAQAALNQLLAQRQNSGGMNAQQLMSQLGAAVGNGTSAGAGGISGLEGTGGTAGAGGEGCTTDTGTTETSGTTTTSTTGTTSARQFGGGQGGAGAQSFGGRRVGGSGGVGGAAGFARGGGGGGRRGR